MTLNVLLSYAYHGKRTPLDEFRRDLVCGRIMIDSGAFTAHTQGKKITLREYAEYLETWRPYWDQAVTLDSIGNPGLSRRNTRYLHDRGLPVMPVFTRGESATEFDAMVRDCGYVCVGGGIGMGPTAMLARAAGLQRRALELGGGIHALGMGAIAHIKRVRPFSVDSSNAGGALQYGRFRYFNGHKIQSVLAKEKHKHRQHWQGLRDSGVDLAVLTSTGKIPNGEGRRALWRSNALADMVADEWVRSVWPVTPPEKLTGWTPGTHIYIAMGTDGSLPCTVQLDNDLHSGAYRPAVWVRHARNHRCARMAAAA